MCVVDGAGVVVQRHPLKGRAQLHVLVLCLVGGGFSLTLETLHALAQQSSFLVTTLQLVFHLLQPISQSTLCLLSVGDAVLQVLDLLLVAVHAVLVQRQRGVLLVDGLLCGA